MRLTYQIVMSLNQTSLNKKTENNSSEFYLNNGFGSIMVPKNENFSNQVNIAEIEASAPYTVYEENGNIRSCYGIHLAETYKNWKSILTETEKFIKEILQDDIYIHQSKINYKESIPTAVWPWHRDFPFWKNYDNIPVSKMINVIVFLDNVYENSGPVQVIPGSHKHFFEEEQVDTKVEFNELTGSVSSDLDFELPLSKVESLALKNGIVSLCGEIGDISLFHPDIIHQSSPGTDDNKRRLMIITYNACSNRPVKPSARPQYFASPDYTPI